jgi:hypothetical protein
MTSHESKQDFDIITMLFSIAPLSDMQLENNEGVDEQDSEIYRSCILFIKQS